MNAKNQNMEVSRSMKVTVQKKKTTFRTLDSLLSITNESGKTKDISKRCADLDSVLHDELGIVFILFLRWYYDGYSYVIIDGNL